MAYAGAPGRLQDANPYGRIRTLRGLIGSLAQLWLVRGPKFLSSWAPSLSDALADGAWTSPWRALTALTPVAALALGFVTSSRWLGLDQLYSNSLLFMAIVVASAILSGAVGLMVLVGYVVGDALSGGGELGRQFASSSTLGPFQTILREGGSQLLTYLLLAIPAISVPRFATLLARAFPMKLPLRRLAQFKARIVFYPLVLGLLIYVWCLGMTVLIRPLFTWRNVPLTAQAVEVFRSQWGWLVLTAMVAALARVLLEEVVQRWSPWRATVARVRRLRQAALAHPTARKRQLPLPVQIVVPAALTTLVLAGLYQGWSDALVVGIVATVLSSWRVGFRGQLPPGLGLRIRQLPPLVRAITALIVGVVSFELAGLLVPGAAGASLSRPLLLAAVFSLVASHVLFPARPLGRLASRVHLLRVPGISG